MIREFDPDIVFAQESHRPEDYLSPDEYASFKGSVHSYVHHGKWGSAILSKNHVLEPVSLCLPEYEGWVVGARIPDMLIGGIPQSVLIFSIHAPSPGPYEPHVDRILGEIAKKWGKSPMIIAGDFNLTMAVRHPTEDLWSKRDTVKDIKLLEKLRKELGVFNAWQVLHPNENLPQTLRWNSNPVPHYHCDAVFLSGSLLTNLESARVESAGEWGTLSDHNPIVVTLE
jgi:endonuclease/exonuclease/phosphatase family metal-dependent hydrolase